MKPDKLSLIAVGCLLGFLFGLVLAGAGHVVADSRKAAIMPTAPAVPPSTIDSDNPANEPFEVGICVQFGALTCPANEPFFITVPTTTPDGRTVNRLVVQAVSGICSITLISGQTSGGVGIVNVGAHVGSSFTGHSFFPAPALGIAGSADGFSQLTRFYGDPGKTLFVNFGSLINLDAASCHVAVSGYFDAQ